MLLDFCRNPCVHSCKPIEKPGATALAEVCRSTPSTTLSADAGLQGFAMARSLAEKWGVWRFYEDVPGKPGWIAEVPPYGVSASQYKEKDLVVNLLVSVGEEG